MSEQDVPDPILEDRAPLTPKDKKERNSAAFRRFVKVTAYTIIGYFLVIGVGLMVYILTKAQVDAALIAILSPLFAGVIAGIHKGLQWRAAPLGVELPDLPGDVSGPMVGPEGGP